MKTKRTGWQIALEAFCVVGFSLVFLGVVVLVYYWFGYFATPIFLAALIVLKTLNDSLNALSGIQQELLFMFGFLFLFLYNILHSLNDLRTLERKRQQQGQHYERKFQDILDAINRVRNEVSFARRGVSDPTSLSISAEI